MQEDNTTRASKGLHSDNSYIDTIKDTYRFALNAVNETHEGDFAFLSNEESNSICDSLTEGFIPIGKIYISNNETVIFSVSSDDTISEIGILDNACNYIVHVNDSNSINKLNFKVSKQIQGVYRLRRGCERTIYFTDDYNKPRYYNLDKPYNFKNNDGTFNSNKFNLQKTYSKIPVFQKVEVLDSGGSLEPGSYNIAIQYVDESLNPTEWITTSNIIKIYNDLSSKTYREINGSVNSNIDYLNFPKTSKAIKITFSNLDTDFLYYRLAIIECNNGSGNINRVVNTETIPISKNFFIYTGINALTINTEEEILQNSDIIEKVESIEQIENRLLLANTEGSQINFCKLQKYASKVKADCVTKQVILSDITDPSNPKNPIQEIGGTGYMPGEIYSFGIVYIFENGSISPVYHIPGRNPNIPEDTVFTPGINAIPMSGDNQSENTTYNSTNNCGGGNYWGLDSEGQTLEGKKVRHHRFPLRSKAEKPLVIDVKGENQVAEYFQVALNIKGLLKVPFCDKEVDPDCTPNTLPSFEIRITYNLNGEIFSFIQFIDPTEFESGISSTYPLDVIQYSKFHSSQNFTDITIAITDINGNYQSEIPITLNSPTSTDEDNIYFEDDAVYTASSELYNSNVQGRLFRTEIFGINFSGIEVPTIEDTNGVEIVGYYIVRNERTEFDKTILDTGILVPCVTNNQYISHGLLQPETSRISSSVFGLIHPEHKFKGKEYVSYDKIIQQGDYGIIERRLGKINYDDVYNGSSFNSKTQKGGNDDGHDPDGSPTGRGLDGWSLNLITRDNILTYNTGQEFELSNNQIKDRFYLDALGHKPINDNGNDVYNIACDNKIGIVQLEAGVSLPSNNLPYVVLYKNNSDPYSNFRVLPYYKENLNPVMFLTPGSSSTSLFNGDTYITSMKYLNTMFYDNRVAKRKGKSGLFRNILGAALALIGAALLVVTGGASTIVIGTGIALIGAGTLFVSSGIKQDNFNRAYNEEYDKGLRQTTLDNWVDMFYNYKNNIPFGFKGNGRTGYDGPSDDTIQWITDCASDLWFESSINMALRNHFVNDSSPTYMDSPSRVENGNNSPIGTWEFFGYYYTNSNSQRYPISALERYVARKLLTFDQNRDDNRFYIGLALGEYYNVNLDYLRKNKQKIFFHLPLEYDCCSNCSESFPHRIHYSEQSFQEELSDNYRIFLPNNYKDIDGETGEITNIFKIRNDLFVHTEEALWQLPRNYQERITDQIVSFIGTGSYFEVPVQRLLDDSTGNSAGSRHKWATIKIPIGVVFVCEKQKKIYLFDGKSFRVLSDIGLSNYFKDNLGLKVNKQYYIAQGTKYPYDNNPSNLLGTGFISTYDTKKERLIITKKDFVLSDDVIDIPDFEICVKNGQLIQFPNYNQIIEDEAQDGWIFKGIEDCRMKFEKEITTTIIEEREVVKTLPNNTHVYIYYDGTGSFDGQQAQELKDSISQWYSNFRPDDVGKTMLHEFNDLTERWLNNANLAISNSLHEGNILVISFINESHPVYHDFSIMNPVIGQPTLQFTQDYNTFVSFKDTVDFFAGITYPILTFGSHSQGPALIQHTLLALKGRVYTEEEFDFLSKNERITDSQWYTTIKDTLTNQPNPYSILNGPTIEQCDWVAKIDRNDLHGSPLITPEQFSQDIDNLLEDIVSRDIIEVETEIVETVYKYIDGVIVADPINRNTSWTMSFSLKQDTWTSWHSYLPNFYINTTEKFYSWINGNNNIWIHNGLLNNYQTFYGKYYPHIIEYVSLSNPIITKIWNHFKFITEAKKFNNSLNEYYEDKLSTFNKLIIFNSRQCSGLLNLEVKDLNSDPINYLLNQTVNLNNNTIIINRNEKDWFVNDLRDIRIDYNTPIWNSNIISLQSEYFIDKILNEISLNVNKDWTQLERFRDKFLVVRLIFDKFADVKLITNYSIENEQQSFN